MHNIVTHRSKEKGMYIQNQELMSAEGAKERVTLVSSKSKLPTYFRFGEALAASCGLSPT